MLQLDVKPLFRARLISKPYAYLVANGFPADAATNIVSGKYKNVPLQHLSRLCELLNCTPNDVLRYTPSASHPLPEKHPLKKLEKREELEQFSQYLESLRGLSIDEMEAFSQELKK